MSEEAREFGFAAAHDAPIPYLQRIRTYYEELGYGAPYRWAHYSHVPFRPLTKQFQLRMSFRKGRVDKSEIIDALEAIIKELKAAKHS